MTFSQSITICLSKYATFSGRASRSEFWWFYLFVILLSWGAQIVDAITFGIGGGPLGAIVSLSLMIPNFAVAARRLHDIGRSGWWQLIAFTIIGIFLLIFWWAKEGDNNENSFGPVENITSP